MLDGSPRRDVVVRTCRDLAAAIPGLDGERLAEANSICWEACWPEVEDEWTLGQLSGRAVTEEAWGRTLEFCGVESAAATRLAVTTYLDHRTDALRVFPDVPPALDALRQAGVMTAVTTNGAADTQRHALIYLGLEGCGLPYLCSMKRAGKP